MTKQPHERVQAKSVSLYPPDWTMIDNWAYANGYTRSLALRRIVKEWAECKWVDSDNSRLVDTRETYTTQEATE